MNDQMPMVSLGGIWPENRRMVAAPFQNFLKTRDFQRWNGVAQDGINSLQLGASMVCSSSQGNKRTRPFKTPLLILGSWVLKPCLEALTNSCKCIAFKENGSTVQLAIFWSNLEIILGKQQQKQKQVIIGARYISLLLGMV